MARNGDPRGNSIPLEDIDPELPASELCLCRSCPVIPRRLMYRDRDELATRLDEPFAYCNEDEAKRIARRVACEYQLIGLVHQFEKAALLIKEPEIYMPSDVQEDTASPVRPLHGSNENGFATGHRQDRAGQMRSRATSQETARGSNLSNRSSTDRSSCLLTADEALALLNEPRLGFWDQPWPFRTTCYMLFVAAVVQGWNQTATNGANLCWLDPLIDGSKAIDCDDEGKHRGIYALISATPFLFAPIGCLLSDPLNEVLMGRRKALMFSAVLIFVSAVGGTFAKRWWELFICRIILGIGMGGKSSVVPVFAAEIAPPHLRGTLIMNWQVFDALGIFFGFSANIIAASAGSGNSWRWQISSSCIPAFALLLCVVLVSWDSPRFLMKHERTYIRKFVSKQQACQTAPHPSDRRYRRAGLQGPAPRQPNMRFQTVGGQLWKSIQFRYSPNPAFGYHSKAFDTLVILRGNQLLAAKELLYTHCQLVLQRLATQRGSLSDTNFSLASGPGYLRRVYDMFQPGYLRRALAAAIVGMIAQQLCGINVLIIYSSRLFRATDQESTESSIPLWISWSIGMTNFLFALPAYWWIESRGRRWLALATLPFLALSMTGAAACFAFDHPAARKIGVGIFTILFTIFYSPGLGPVPFTIAAEVFPLDYRMVGMSIASMTNFGLAGGIAMAVPFVNKEYILLGIFAVTNVAALVLVWAFLREPEVAPPDNATGTGTTFLQLEEMFQVFEPGLMWHVRFQWQRKLVAPLSFLDFLCGRPTVPPQKQYFRSWYDEQQEEMRQENIQTRVNATANAGHS